MQLTRNHCAFCSYRRSRPPAPMLQPLGHLQMVPIAAGFLFLYLGTRSALGPCSTRLREAAHAREPTSQVQLSTNKGQEFVTNISLLSPRGVSGKTKSKVCSTQFLRVSSTGLSPSRPQRSPLNSLPLIGFPPSPAHFPNSFIMVPEITSQMNCLYQILISGSIFRGTQREPRGGQTPQPGGAWVTLRMTPGSQDVCSSGHLLLPPSWVVSNPVCSCLC